MSENDVELVPVDLPIPAEATPVPMVNPPEGKGKRAKKNPKKLKAYIGKAGEFFHGVRWQHVAIGAATLFGVWQVPKLLKTEDNNWKEIATLLGTTLAASFVVSKVGGAKAKGAAFAVAFAGLSYTGLRCAQIVAPKLGLTKAGMRLSEGEFIQDNPLIQGAGMYQQATPSYTTYDLGQDEAPLFDMDDEAPLFGGDVDQIIPTTDVDQIIPTTDMF